MSPSDVKEEIAPRIYVLRGVAEVDKVISEYVMRGDERFEEEGETAKKDREEGERKQKIGRRENQHKKGGRRMFFKKMLH